MQSLYFILCQKRTAITRISDSKKLGHNSYGPRNCPRTTIAKSYWGCEVVKIEEGRKCVLVMCWEHGVSLIRYQAYQLLCYMVMLHGNVTWCIFCVGWLRDSGVMDSIQLSHSYESWWHVMVACHDGMSWWHVVMACDILACISPCVHFSSSSQALLKFSVNCVLVK